MAFIYVAKHGGISVYRPLLCNLMLPYIAINLYVHSPAPMADSPFPPPPGYIWYTHSAPYNIKLIKNIYSINWKSITLGYKTFLRASINITSKFDFLKIDSIIQFCFIFFIVQQSHVINSLCHTFSQLYTHH
jgi:hypothetical protein